MSQRPTVSVMTCVYNGARFIEETMTSVLGQQDVAVDYHVIDGASTDGTVEIIRRHADHLAGWLSEPDEGIADAFNKGIDRAKGDYLMFLNADDALAHPRALADLLTHAEANKWPDVIYGDCDLCDPDTGRFLYCAAIDYSCERFLRGDMLPHPGMLMHRRYFEKYGRFDPSFSVAMDYELFLRGVPVVGAVHAPVLVTKVRTGGVSTRNRGAAVRETIRALKMHGYLKPLSEARMRAAYFTRGMMRRALEGAGLYRAFVALRHRREKIHA